MHSAVKMLISRQRKLDVQLQLHSPERSADGKEKAGRVVRKITSKKPRIALHIRNRCIPSETFFDRQ